MSKVKELYGEEVLFLIGRGGGGVVLKETTQTTFVTPPGAWAVGGGRMSSPLGTGINPSPWVCVAGVMYRKSCASSAACLIASAGYQSFCSPGKLNSVCISCCNTPLCNGPRPKKRSSSALALRPGLPTTVVLLHLALLLAHC